MFTAELHKRGYLGKKRAICGGIILDRGELCHDVSVMALQVIKSQAHIILFPISYLEKMRWGQCQIRAK